MEPDAYLPYEPFGNYSGNIPALDPESQDYAGHGGEFVDYSQIPLSNTQGVDIDLTDMSSAMVYGVVFQMLFFPEEFAGKTLRMEGDFFVYFNPDTNRNYYSTIVHDALACCTQGLEFALKDGEYPEDYPDVGQKITVTGVLEVYQELDYENIHIVDAQWN